MYARLFLEEFNDAIDAELEEYWLRLFRGYALSGMLTLFYIVSVIFGKSAYHIWCTFARDV